MHAPIKLARKLGTFDAVLIVMGGIIGSGVFMTPSLVAKYSHTAPLMVATWAFGGVVAVIGAFIFAELAWRRPDVQGMYGYLRDAFHPVVAFVAGWTALLVSMTGGIAANGVTFGTYFQPLTHWNLAPAWAAVAAIVILSVINCLGVREGGTTQNIFMILKALAIVSIIAAGLFWPGVPVHAAPATLQSFGAGALLLGFCFALVPVLFAYDGWQTAPYLDQELKTPVTSLPRALVWGMVAVAILYILVAVAGAKMLGMAGLAASAAPASDMMRRVAGDGGARLVSAGIAISTFGFMSNSILTAPRIYYAMAKDGIFFKQFAYLHPKTRAPIFGIAVQAFIAIAITLSGSYGQILAFVVAVDFVYFAIIGVAVFTFRKRDAGSSRRGISVPGHPWTTIAFMLISAGVVGFELWTSPAALIGLGILATGVPAYLFWHKRAVTPGRI